jgi:hypothetical protein
MKFCCVYVGEITQSHITLLNELLTSSLPSDRKNGEVQLHKLIHNSFFCHLFFFDHSPLLTVLSQNPIYYYRSLIYRFLLICSFVFLLLRLFSFVSKKKFYYIHVLSVLHFKALWTIFSTSSLFLLFFLNYINSSCTCLSPFFHVLQIDFIFFSQSSTNLSFNH